MIILLSDNATLIRVEDKNSKIDKVSDSWIIKKSAKS